MRALLLALTIGLAVPAVAGARDVSRYYTPAFRACMDAADGVTVDTHNCLADEYARTDQRLNDAYRRRMAALGAERKAALRSSQRAWLKATKVRCEAEGDQAGTGSIWPLAVDSCWIDANIERILFIDAFR